MESTCPYHRTIALIGDKWSLEIIKELYLAKEPLRFNALQEAVEPISSKTLSAKLKELQAHGLVEKHILSTMPLIGAYTLTTKGLDLSRILEDMKRWSQKWYAKREDS